MMRLLNFNYNKYLALIAALLLAVQCGRKSKPVEKISTIKDENIVSLTDAQFRNAPIQTSALTNKQISNVIKLNGKVDIPPKNLVSVSLPLGGYLKTTNLLPGMKVVKGQMLAVIENQQFIRLQQDYLTAKSRYHFAELDYNRQKTLNQSQASSDKVMQLAQSEMNTQQINMDALAQQLRLINIHVKDVLPGNIKRSVPVYSTIDGFVSKVNVNIGRYIAPSEVLFELINPTDIHLNLKVYEKDLEMLKIGQHLVAYTNVQPDKKYYGKIILISRDIDANGLADVHCHFDHYDYSLVPGIYMNAEIQTEITFSDALPEESIVDFEGKSYVFIEEKKQSYRLTPIITGKSQSGFIEVLNSSDFRQKKIVTKNAYLLLMQLKNTADDS